MQVPSVWRATAITSDVQVSQLTAPLLYEQVPVQYWSHAVHTRTLYLPHATDGKYSSRYLVDNEDTFIECCSALLP